MVSVTGCRKKTPDAKLQGTWVLDLDGTKEHLKAGEERMSDERLATFAVGLIFGEQGDAELIALMGEQREENSGTYEVTKVGEDTVDLNLTLGRSEDDQSTKAVVVTFLNDDQILFVPAERKRDSLVLKRSSKKEMQEVLSAENS